MYLLPLRKLVLVPLASQDNVSLIFAYFPMHYALTGGKYIKYSRTKAWHWTAIIEYNLHKKQRPCNVQQVLSFISLICKGGTIKPVFLDSARTYLKVYKDIYNQNLKRIGEFQLEVLRDHMYSVILSFILPFFRHNFGSTVER